MDKNISRKLGFILHALLVGKPEGRRQLGRPRHRWVGNIKIDLREIGWYGLDQSDSR
jgi:hypothetical protein